MTLFLRKKEVRCTSSDRQITSTN